jgi:hypothetical protein
MATNGLETVPDSKVTGTGPETRTSRPTAGQKAASDASPTPRRRRGRKETAETATVERFFLAETNGNNAIPALGREMSTEAEAIVEAFRSGVNFFAISEFRTRAETSSSRYPVIKKEATRNSNHSS